MKQRADMALLTIPKTKYTEASAGRVFVDEDGQALDIIEQVDLARQMIADELRAMLAKAKTVTGGDVLAVVERHIPRPEKQAVAVAELLALAKSRRGRSNGRSWRRSSRPTSTTWRSAESDTRASRSTGSPPA